MGVMSSLLRSIFGPTREIAPPFAPMQLPAEPAWAPSIAVTHVEKESRGSPVDALRAKSESDVRMGAAESFYRTYGEAVWVYRCVNAIAQSIAEVPIKFYRERYSLVGGQRFEPFSSPLSRALLKKANPQETMFDLVEETLVHLELTGDAYIEMVPMVGRLELYALPPHQMKILPHPKRLVAGYEQWVSSRRVAEWAPEEILHLKYFSPSSDLHGMPPALAAAKSVIVDLLARVYNTNFFSNNASVDVAIQYDRIVGDELLLRLGRQWKALHGGVANAHGVAVIDGGGKITTVGTTHKDMAFDVLTRMSREEQLAAFGVPPVKVGLLEGGALGGDQARIQREEFWRGTLFPKMRKIEARFDSDVCAHLGEGIVARFDLAQIRDLQINQREQAEWVNSYLTNGVITINRARQIIGEPGRVPWGDTWHAPMGVAPVELPDAPSRPAEPEPDVTAPELEETAEVEDAAETDEEPKRDDEFGGGQVPARVPLTQRGDLRADYARVLDREFGKRERFSEIAKTRMWKARDRRVRQSEKKMLAALEREFARQSKQAVGRLDEVYRRARLATAGLGERGDRLFRAAAQRVLAADVFFDGKELADLFKVFGLLQAEESGEATAGLLGRKEWLKRREAIDDFLAKKVASAVKVNATTQEKIRNVLGDAAEELPRPTLSEVTRRVKGVFEQASLGRATVIAQTETIRSYGFGEVEAYKQAGVAKKGWLSQRDGKTRPSHKGVAPVDVDKAFSVGGARLQFPGDPGGPADETINCRCGTVPEFE